MLRVAARCFQVRSNIRSDHFGRGQVCRFFQRLVLQHGPITAQDNLALGRVLTDQRDRLLHLVHDREQEGDADVIVAFLEFADQLALRRILQDGRWGVEVLGDVFEGIMNVKRPRAEKALGAGDLPVKEFIAYGGGIAVFRPHGATDARQKNFRGHRQLFVRFKRGVSGKPGPMLC